VNNNQKKGRLIALRLQKEEAESKTARATKILFWAAGINLIGGILLFLQFSNLFMLVFSGLISIVVVGLGFWSKKTPLIALAVSFVFLAGLFSIDFINYQKVGLLGLALRAVILVFLVQGVYNVFNSQKVLKEFKALEADLSD